MLNFRPIYLDRKPFETLNQTPLIKKYLRNFLSFNWVFGLWLILIFSVLRVLAVLYGIQSGDNKYLSILFVIMMLSPFLLLTKEARHKIGFRKPNKIVSLLSSLLLGAFSCLLIFLLGKGLYGYELSNWFRYIGECYPLDFSQISASDKQVYFIVFVLIGMTFSPLGEEIFYRGMVHGSLVTKFGEKGAAVIDSSAFGLVHLAHFGIIYYLGQWSVLWIPGLLWMLLIFFTGLLFNYCRLKSNSIYGAIFSHIGFNISMTYFIFYHIF